MTRFSDHCIIKVSLRTTFSVNGVNDAYSHLPQAPAKVIWKSQYKNRLENTLYSAQCQFDIAQFCSTAFGHNQLGVNAATTQLNNIITTATRLVISSKFSGRRKKKYMKKWYDRNCLQLRNELNRLSHCLSKEPFNSCLRKAFIQCRRTCKQFLKTTEKEYFGKLKLQLRNLEKDNPKQFWNIIKNLQNDNNVNIKTQLNMRHGKYLKQLYSSEPQGNKFIQQSTNQEPFQNHDAEAIDQIINRVITVNEVKQAIRKVKNGKAVGEDSIINEVLKLVSFVWQNQSQSC